MYKYINNNKKVEIHPLGCSLGNLEFTKILKNFNPFIKAAFTAKGIKDELRKHYEWKEKVRNSNK